MAIATYEPLATIALTGPDSEIVFGSIPSRFRDLVLTYSGTGNTASNILIKINNDVSALSFVQMGATGSGSPYSGAGSGIGYVGEIGSDTKMSTIYIFDYATTDRHKTILTRDNGANSRTQQAAIRWANNAAINQVAIYCDGGGNTFSAGSRFSLFGIAG